MVKRAHWHMGRWVCKAPTGRFPSYRDGQLYTTKTLQQKHANAQNTLNAKDTGAVTPNAVIMLMLRVEVTNTSELNLLLLLMKTLRCG